MNSVTDGRALRRSQQTEFISAVLRWHLWFNRAAFERLAPQTQCSRAPPHTRRGTPRSHVCCFTAQMELDVSVRVFLDRQGVCAYHHHHHHITMAAGGSQMTGGQTVIRPSLLTLSWEPERLKIFISVTVASPSDLTHISSTVYACFLPCKNNVFVLQVLI